MMSHSKNKGKMMDVLSKATLRFYLVWFLKQNNVMLVVRHLGLNFKIEVMLL